MTRAGVGPDFLCVGAQKGGTTWLYDQLQLHPDFWMPPVKELHYFDARLHPIASARWMHDAASRDLADFNRKRIADLYRPFDERDLSFIADLVALSSRDLDTEAYARLFSYKRAAVSGDITPGYSILGSPRVKKITKRFPALKVVFIARDPVKRFWSQVGMKRVKGRIDGPTNVDRIRQLLDARSFRRRSFQTRIVARWRRELPQGQFGLFFFDDLLRDPTGLRRDILAFLGADPNKPSGSIPPGFNRAEGSPREPMPEDVRDMLVEHFADELKASAVELGGPAAGWPKAYGL